MSTQEIKGNLARLLATENLIVEHRVVATASFDVDRRVLTLPNWDRASSTVYDLLVGHEVGHALFTPNEDWRDAANCPKDYINVVEDARIEKLMKRKFPGLRKSFSNGYAELNEQDFFGIADEDLSKMSLIDRINLHFKCGANALMPFSIEEKVFVARCDLAETFEEVCSIANDIYAFVNAAKEEQEVDVQMPADTNQNGGEEGDQEQTSAEQQESESSEEDQPDATPQAGGTSGGSTSSGADLEDVRDDWYDEDGNMTEPEGSSTEGGETSKTQRAFDSSVDSLIDNHRHRSVTYVQIPEKIDLNDIVVDWSEVHEWIDQYYNGLEGRGEDFFAHASQEYKSFRKESQKEVNYLVKEFECRKSADAYARAGESKTGVLDTTKLHTYRYNEDIFKKVTVVPDGKNHGLVFLMDWSGSIAPQLHSTYKQLLNLTAFCKKVQIPFEVYAFTNEWRIVNHMKNNTVGEHRSTFYYHDTREDDLVEGEVSLGGNNFFHLMNILSSRSNSKEYERQCQNIWKITYSYTTSAAGYIGVPNGLELSGTPLNEAIIAMNYVIPKFQKENDLQKVNLCILTDGDGCMTGYGRKGWNYADEEECIVRGRMDCNNALRDRKTGRVYPQFQDSYHAVTNTFIQQLRDRNPNVNVLGFRVMNGSNLLNFVHNYAADGYTEYDRIREKWKKEKSAIIDNPISYTALYAIAQTSLEADTEFNVESGAKKGEITKAFKKMLKGKSTNKKLLNSFVGYIA